MVVIDRRDEFRDSDSNLPTVAAESHRLYESDDFQEDVVDALVGVFRQHLDCEAVDAAAEEVLREWFVKEGMGGLFQLRNQIVTNRETDLDEGDAILLERRDGGTAVPFIIHSADPEKTGVYVYRIDPESGEISPRDYNAGLVKFGEHYTVNRSRRGDRPMAVAHQMADEITGDEDA